MKRWRTYQASSSEFALDCFSLCAQGEKDWQKYEVARKLKLKVETIRRLYREDWKNREMKTRQRGVALYFIDKVQTSQLSYRSVVNKMQALLGHLKHILSNTHVYVLGLGELFLCPIMIMYSEYGDVLWYPPPPL